jgi:hypothetical protein
MSVVQEDRRFDLLRDDDNRAWWEAVQDAARSTIAMQTGSRIYVTEHIDALALHDARRAFLKVHVVSVATGSPYEFYRVVSTPAVRRLLPVAKIANIAPVVDLEAAIQA